MSSVFLYDKRVTDHSLSNTFSSFTPLTEPGESCDILFRWGNPHGSDEMAKLVFNRKIPLKNCLDREKTFEILRVNKIRRPRFVVPQPDSVYPLIGKFFDSTTNLLKDKVVNTYTEAINSEADFFVEYIDLISKYNVYVFDLNVFFLTKKIAVRTTTTLTETEWAYVEVPTDLDQNAQKVCHLGQRALYVLGLDLGMAHIGIDIRGRAVALDITPTPALPIKAGELLHEKLEDFLALNQTYSADENVLPVNVEPIILGADPEFMFRDSRTGKLVYPSEYLEQEGILGYDERSENRQGQFFPLAEVRPHPEICPVKLTENIRQILVTAASMLPPYVEWLAGSLQFEQYQIGGHIHFSNVRLNTGILRALDNYLGIPVFLIEDPRTSAKRRRQYGWIGSFRVKSHGGFEYRTPGSWLVSPEITRSCLTLAKIVVTEYRKLRRDYFTDIELQKAFYQAKKFYFYDIFNELWKDITKTSLYSLYAEYLSPIKNMIESGAYWNENEDLRKAWGLQPESH